MASSINNTILGPAPEHSGDESIDLFDLAVRFLAQWRLLIVSSFLFFLLCVAIIYSIKPLFEADATLLPQGNNDASSLSAFFSTRSPGDVFIGLLGSRSVQDDVIDRLDLMKLYKLNSREIARRVLAASSSFNIGKGTLISILIRSDNAETAQRIANAYLDALQDQREGMLSREAEVHDRFYEQQLRREADALAAAEKDLMLTQKTSGLVQPDAQTSIGINAIAGLRAQITQLQVQLAAAHVGATDQNAQVENLRAQIAQLQVQEHALESAPSGAVAGVAAGANRMPELNLEYTRKAREVRYHEALFTSISNQYEAARLNEGYSGASFVVIDRAVAPERKAWPPRTIMLALSIVFSGIVGCVVVCMRLIGQKLMADPANVEKLRILGNSFHRAR